MNNFIFTALFIGLLVISLLITYGVKKEKNNWLLIGSLFCLMYALFATWLIDTNTIAKVPYLSRTGNIFGYLIYPFMYLFIRNMLYPGRMFKKMDVLFMVPALFYCIDMIPFFLLSNNEKILIVKNNLLNNKNTFPEGWLVHPTFHFGLRTYWAVFIHILIGILLYNNKPYKHHQNKNVFHFLLTLALIFLPLTLVNIYGITNNPQWWNNHIFSVTLGTPLFASGIYLLFSPGVMYGSHSLRFNQRTDKQDNQQDILVEFNENGKTDEIPKSKFDYEIVADHIGQLVLFMENDKPFIEPNLSLHKLADLTNIPVYIISNIINHHFKSNFNTWINSYRIQYFFTLTDNPDLKQFTIEALAMKSGFANRVTFNVAFKREIGESPGKYLKSNPKKQVI